MYFLSQLWGDFRQWEIKSVALLVCLLLFIFQGVRAVWNMDPLMLIPLIPLCAIIMILSAVLSGSYTSPRRADDSLTDFERICKERESESRPSSGD